MVQPNKLLCMCRLRDFFLSRCVFKQILESGAQPLSHPGVLLQRADGGLQTKADDTLTYMVVVEKTHLTWCVAKRVDFGIRQCSTCYSLLMSKSFYLSEFVSSSIKWKENNRMKWDNAHGEKLAQGLWYSWQLISVLDLPLLLWEMESVLPCVMEKVILHELSLVRARAASLPLWRPFAHIAAQRFPFQMCFSQPLTQVLLTPLGKAVGLYLESPQLLS